MRDIVSPLLTAIGILCIYLFACGVTITEGGSFLVIVDRATVPFREMTPFSTVMLGTAVIALTLALVFPRELTTPASLGRQSWGRVLQVALLCDVGLVAVILTLLILPGTGWFPGFSPTPTAMGALFLAAVLEAALGTCLVVALLGFKKPRGLYLSSVFAHVTELGLLGVIFYLGSRP